MAAAVRMERRVMLMAACLGSPDDRAVTARNREFVAAKS
jgi:hypothetical protein